MINPLDYLVFAESINENAKQESEVRTVINRAYYATHLYIKGKLGISSLKQSIHQDVIAVLIDNKKPHISKIGGKLLKLFDARKDADYGISLSFDVHNSRAAISLAKLIIKDFDQINPLDYY